MTAGKHQIKNVENNGAVVYVESSLTEHNENPLFFVHKLGLNKLIRCFCWSVSSKSKECYEKANKNI